ncbi:unnamed protein product [Didymodactylos carnosus]|uniref:Uncharacterized protein n=1 Tax=Didymodactylos carnosus TaxID=1234261 RepID=A0A814JBR2_9BILA|nr:unnamed protein product [Didymodactylos carnosus]CAF1113873.1 unnamed protein product [Didymodactylos carnosus]CAF3805270.1 unnamed protein product [Didymodactylos carnosus]CAF3882836.1 unnamed protein product [Didymodactylos carnosus]
MIFIYWHYRSHTTHALQPLDVYTLKIVKTEWRRILNDDYQKTHASAVDKSVFPMLFKQLYGKALRPAHCAGGFAMIHYILYIGIVLDAQTLYVFIVYSR